MIAILGAGLAGLSTAYHLQRGGCRDWALFEREDRPGGLCRSESRDGFTFDYTGHFLHLRDRDVRRRVRRWLGDGLGEVARTSRIWSHGVYTNYPFQTNTYGLPVEVVKDVLLGAVEAQEGRAAVPEEPVDDQGLPEPRDSFERWIYETFGPGTARHFMIPYNDKLWSVHPRCLTTHWMGRYVPPAPLEQVIEGALTDRTASVGYNATFDYPRRGGIETLVRAFAQRVPGIVLGRKALSIDGRRHRVTFDDGSTTDYETLISTIPLPELVALLTDAPGGVREAGARLRCSSVFAVNLGVRGDRTDGRQWVYVPERRYGFYRAGCYSNAAASMAPRGCSTLWVEFSHNPHRPLDRQAARRQALAGLQDMGFLDSTRDIETEWLLDIPCAYVTFDAHHARATAHIHRYLTRHGIHPIGRYGRWEYSSMEDALLQGSTLARQLLEKDPSS